MGHISLETHFARGLSMQRTWIVGIVIVIAVGAVAAYLTFQPNSSLNTVTFTLTGVEDVSPAHLEGWAIFGTEKVSTGKFDVGDPLTFTMERDLREADMLVITIEPEDDMDTDPSGIVLLAGSVVDNSADLAFPIDLSTVNGTYILATPTDGAETNELSGIWFLQLPGPPTAGLSLPDLETGWVYEGWVVNAGTPLTSGRFTSPEDFDLFDGYSSTEPGPPFPGEDYLVNAPMGLTFPIDLSDGESLAVISVEPDLNSNDPTGDAPFVIKPLVGNIPLGAQDHINYQMDQNLASVPSGTATIT
jgi:hypothetical protein